MQPKISICIPTYNYAHFIADAIESVLSQTVSDYELLVIDNCSTDNTEEVVLGYLQEGRNVKYIRNEKNLGLVCNLNRCIELASGTYIKILCSDDLLEATCLEKMVQVLEANPKVSLVASARQLVDRSLNNLGQLAYSDRPELLPGIEVIRKCLFVGNLIGEPTAVLFRKKDAIAGFDPEYRQLVDLEMWFRLLEQGDFAFIPEALCLIRQHEEQGTNANIKGFIYVDDQFRLFDDYADKSYMELSYFQKLEARFDIAQALWKLDMDVSLKKTKTAEYHGLCLYYMLNISKKIKQLLFGKKKF